jgi:hypothetical protein
VEGSEFELPVPVSKLSDGIMLEFATARRIALIARRLQCGRRYCRDIQRKHFAQRAIRDNDPLAEQRFGEYCRVSRSRRARQRKPTGGTEGGDLPAVGGVTELHHKPSHARPLYCCCPSSQRSAGSAETGL